MHHSHNVTYVFAEVNCLLRMCISYSRHWNWLPSPLFHCRFSVYYIVYAMKMDLGLGHAVLSSGLLFQVGKQHLAQSFMFVGSAPRFLDCNNVLWFSDRWAETIGSTKLLDKVVIVHKWVLAGQWKSRRSDTRDTKYFTVTMKRLQGHLNHPECVLWDDRTANKIAEVNEGCYCSNHLRRNMACNCWEENLHMYSMLAEIYMWNERNVYLHECLRVITCPLLESSPLLELAQARKWWGSCNPKDC